jgi:hypothetical protein
VERPERLHERIVKDVGELVVLVVTQDAPDDALDWRCAPIKKGRLRPHLAPVEAAHDRRFVVHDG